MKKHRRPVRLFRPVKSGRLLVTLAPSQVGMFRFLLEAYDNLALFTVLDRHEALLKILFSPHQERAVRAALAEIGERVALSVLPWPELEACPEAPALSAPASASGQQA